LSALVLGAGQEPLVADFYMPGPDARGMQELSGFAIHVTVPGMQIEYLGDK